MKNIHCYITSLGGGGAERQMVYLCNFLNEKGFDVTLVTFLDKEDKYYLPPSIKRICFKYRTDANIFIKLFIRLKLFFYFITIKSDCVISFLTGANVQVLKSLRFRKKVKVIVSERNIVNGELTKTERKAFLGLYKYANYIVPNSITMTSYLRSLKTDYTNRLVTITNFTDTSLYMAPKIPLREILVIGIFARYHNQKNCMRFAKMLSMIDYEQHRPFVVKWYGDKQEISCQQYYKELEDYILEKHIEKIFELHDFATDIPNLMADMDMICLPSIFEGFSNSLAEAICCGKPVIAGDVSDNSVMVKDGINGFLFDPFNIDNMKMVFERALETSNENLIKMSQESRKIAEDLFSKEKFVGSYIQLINA